MKFNRQFNNDTFDYSAPEINSGEVIVNTLGYISPQEQVFNFLRAGDVLIASRCHQEYDFDFDDEIDFDVDPTRDLDFDLQEARDLMSEITERMQEQAKVNENLNIEKSELKRQQQDVVDVQENV